MSFAEPLLHGVSLQNPITALRQLVGVHSASSLFDDTDSTSRIYIRFPLSKNRITACHRLRPLCNAVAAARSNNYVSDGTLRRIMYVDVGLFFDVPHSQSGNAVIYLNKIPIADLSTFLFLIFIAQCQPEQMSDFRWQALLNFFAQFEFYSKSGEHQPTDMEALLQSENLVSISFTFHLDVPHARDNTSLYSYPSPSAAPPPSNVPAYDFDNADFYTAPYDSLYTHDDLITHDLHPIDYPNSDADDGINYTDLFLQRTQEREEREEREDEELKDFLALEYAMANYATTSAQDQSADDYDVAKGGQRLAQKYARFRQRFL